MDPPCLLTIFEGLSVLFWDCVYKLRHGTFSSFCVLSQVELFHLKSLRIFRELSFENYQRLPWQES